MCKTAWCARCRIHFRLSTAKTGNKNRPSVPRPQQLVGARRCPPQPRADNEAAARIGDRHGIGHSGILSDNSAYTRIIGVYALVSSAGESDSTRLLLAITSRSNSAAGRRAHCVTAQGPRPEGRRPRRIRSSAARRHQARRAGHSSGLSLATHSEASPLSAISAKSRSLKVR